MSDASLQIKIGADVKDAAKGIDDTKRKLAELYAKLDEAKSRQSLLINPKNIADAQKQINGISKEIDKLEGNQGFSKLGVSAQGVLAPLNNVYGSVRKLAYALPGIGIAGLFTLGFEGLAAAVESFAGASNEAQKAQEGLNKALGEGSAKEQGQIAELTDLASIALNTANSTKLRSDAFAKLQSQYPGYLGNLSLEKSSYDDLQKALDKVSAALVRQSQIKGLEGAIEETYKNLNKTVAEGGTTFEKVTSNIAGFVAGLTDSVGGVKGFSDAFDKAKAGSISHSIGEDSRKAQNEVDLLNNKLKDLLKTSLTEGDDALKDKVKKPPTDKQQQDETLRFLEETKKNLEDITKIDTRPIFQRFNDSANGAFAKLNADILKEKIAKAITDGTKNGVSPENIRALTDSMKGLFDKKANANLSVAVTPIIEIAKPENVDKQIQAQFKKIDINAYMHLVIGGFDQDEIKEKEEEIKEKIKRLKKQFKDSISSDIGGIATDEIVNFGSIIGDSLNGSGADLDSAIKNIASILGQGLKTIGQLYIETAIAIALAKKTFSALAISNPVAAIAVGVGLEILGTVLENTVQKKSAHAFATGGIVTQATLGLVGEAGPEAIFPLSQLDKFIKNTQGAGNMRVDFRGKLQGNDIRLSQDRTAKQQSMV